MRSSDLAVAAAACVVSWLLLRTALRLEVLASVVGAAAGYALALVARSRAGDGRREDVGLPLAAYLVGLVVVRVFEAESFTDRGASVRAVFAVLAVGLAALLGARRGSSVVFSSLAVGSVALAYALGASAAAWSALWLLTLARMVAQCARAVGASRLPALALVAAIGAAVWATRGATIGPLALLVGLAGEAGGLEVGDGPDDVQPHAAQSLSVRQISTDPKVESSRRSLAPESIVFALASGAIVLARAWERSTLVFL